MRLEDVWCVIPVHNNRDTIVRVATECRSILPYVVVVDDGSTDVDVQALFAGTDITVLKHPFNRGKGAAILSGLRHVHTHNGRYMLTLDGDGQHDPQDIVKVLPLLQENDPCLVVGARDLSVPNVPRKSQFGRSFSNFWLRLETGVALEDSQSGFRAYPVALLAQMRFFARRYDFEMEVLARASWAGIPLLSVPIRVWYPPETERVSSFSLFWDNVRISLAHGRLIGRRLFPFPHKRLVPRTENPWNLLRHPRQFMMSLLKENATPEGLAASAAVSSFLALLPLVGLHVLAILYVSARLNLNKPMALGIQNIYMAPFGPLACIQLGYFLRTGTILVHAPEDTLLAFIHQRLYEWLLGSLILSPLMAMIAGIAVFFVSRTLSRRMVRHG